MIPISIAHTVDQSSVPSCLTVNCIKYASLRLSSLLGHIKEINFHRHSPSNQKEMNEIINDPKGNNVLIKHKKISNKSLLYILSNKANYSHEHTD